MFRELHKVKEEIIDGMFNFLLEKGYQSTFRSTCSLLSHVNEYLTGNLTSGMMGNGKSFGVVTTRLHYGSINQMETS